MMKSWEEHPLFGLANQAYCSNQSVFLDALDRKSGCTILDLGCNNGDFTLKIAERSGASEIFGLDSDDAMVAQSCAKGIKAIEFDLNRVFPFPDNCFDIVTANQVVEHLYNTDNFFQEIRRVLKHGGGVIISTLNLCSWHNLCLMLFGMQPVGAHLIKVNVGNFLYGTETHGHIKLMSLAALKDIARYYDFRIEKVSAAGYYPFSDPLGRIF